MGEYECPKCGCGDYTRSKQPTYNADVRMKVCVDCGHSMISGVLH